MKQALLFIAFVLCAGAMNAQNCTGCTVTISGTNSSPQVVGPGTTLCITSTGIVMGPVAVTGGTLCNEGTIVNNALSVTSGTFNNYGIVTLDSISVSGSGIINNYNSISTIAFGVGSSGKLINYGTVDCDSIGVLGSQADLTNSGTINVNYDMGVGTGATANNSGTIGISGDIGIDQGASFANSCLVDVTGDFYNAGAITGPTVSGVGRWVVDALSVNAGSFCNTGICDMCDQGMPAGGFDVNTGTTGPANLVTYCTATAQPCGPTSIEESLLTAPVSISPNPATGTAMISYALLSSQEVSIILSDISGRKVKELVQKGTEGNNVLSLDISSLQQGIYFVMLKTENEIRMQRLVVQD